MKTNLTIIVESREKQFKIIIEDLELTETNGRSLGKKCRRFLDAFEHEYLANTLVPGVGMAEAILSVVENNAEIREKILKEIRKGLQMP